MIKDKKYKYNITFHNRIFENINNKLTDYKFGYTSEDIFNAIDKNFSDRNILNTYDVKDDRNEETALIQKEIIKKDEERLMNNETMSEQDKEKLLEENKKLMETIKKVEHAEIKEWLLESSEIENENKITDKLIQEMRNNYFDFLYGNSNVIREYNEDGTYELVRDHSLDDIDREASRAERKKIPNTNSGTSNTTEYNLELIIKLTEYTPI